MYGIVNKAIKGLIQESLGNEGWDEVRNKAGVGTLSFLSNESYPDSVTYDLTAAAAEVMGVSAGDVLISFGEYWVLKTGQDNYGSLLASGGANLKDFLINLPNFHSRVMLMYPNLTPPEFKVSDIESSSLVLKYYSERDGLTNFVVGLIQGLAKMFNTTVNIELLSSKSDGYDHDTFKIDW